MKIPLLILLSVFFCFSLNAQQVVKEIVASEGASLKGPEFSISYTVGEPYIGEANGPLVSLSQGFQQGLEELATSLQPSLFQTQLKVFPNPSSDILQIELRAEVPVGLIIDLYNAEGRLVLKERTKELMLAHSANLTVSKLPKGLYQLILYDQHLRLIDAFTLQITP